MEFLRPIDIINLPTATGEWGSPLFEGAGEDDWGLADGVVWLCNQQLRRKLSAITCVEYSYTCLLLTGTLTAIRYWNEYDKANCFNLNIYCHKDIMILTLLLNCLPGPRPY